MKKGLAYALVGVLSFSMLQMPVQAYENTDSEKVKMVYGIFTKMDR